MPGFKKSIRKALKGAFGLTKREEVVLVTDESRLELMRSFASEIEKVGANVNTYLLMEDNRPYERATDYFEKSMKGMDLLIYALEDIPEEKPFRSSMVELGRRNGRVCMMPGATEEVLERTLDVDYEELEEFTVKVADYLRGREEITVTNYKGTDISFSVENREFEPDVGRITRRGGYGNLPAGETFTAPVEDSFTGKVCFDHISDFNINEGYFEFEEGVVTGHNGIPDQLEKVMEQEKNRTVGEFGVGTNPKAKPCSNFLEAEKARNTVHFAIGDSYGLGRNHSRYHYDFLVSEPTVTVDGRKLLEEGEFVFE